jgi:hypothetical protein
MGTVTEGQANRVLRLEKLGFKTAATDLALLVERKRKLALAYEHYRYVTPEKVGAFNTKLLHKSGKNLHSMVNMEYQVLVFTPIQDYATVPPEEVLAALETAQDRKCFDSYEIASIKNVKDPLLFGRVEGTANRFFIAQWDTDVSIDDLLKENEG